jgi:acetyl esterase/lipase
VLFSPCVDLSLAALASTAPGDVISRAFIEECASQYLGGHPADDPLASPIFADLRGLPPTLIQAGGDEFLVTDARRLGAALMAAAVTVELQEYPSRWHVFQQNAGMVADAGRALDAAASFVGSHLRESTATP